MVSSFSSFGRRECTTDTLTDTRIDMTKIMRCFAASLGRRVINNRHRVKRLSDLLLIKAFHVLKSGSTPAWLGWITLTEEI